MSAIFPSFDLESPHAGAIGTYSRPTRSGRILECLFCKTCGCRLVHKKEWDPTWSVKGGCLENLSLKDAIHIYCKEAVAEIPTGAVKFDGEPDDEHNITVKVKQ